MDDLCDSGVIDSPRRCPAVCREAVFGDLRRPPQIYHGHVRSIFVIFRTSFDFLSSSLKLLPPATSCGHGRT